MNIASSFLLSALTAFAMGFFGSVHCIGMCGGFACLFNRSKLWLYHVGRIFTYTILGALTGLLGVIISQQFNHTGAVLLRMLSGVFVIAMGLYLIGWTFFFKHIETLGAKLWNILGGSFKGFTQTHQSKQALIMGSIWGMLPCGLVYSALVYAMTAGSWYGGASLMLCFGLGTLPALVFAQFLFHKRKFVISPILRSLLAIIMMGFGVFLVWVNLMHLVHKLS